MEAYYIIYLFFAVITRKKHILFWDYNRKKLYLWKFTEEIMIERAIKSRIEERMFRGKLIIVYGARQTGKTTLIKELAKKLGEDARYLNCDEPDIRQMLEDANSTGLKRLAGSSKVLFIDEAQRVKNIGLTLKLFADTLPDCQVIATGSSSFELSNLIKEPLTGRYYDFKLFPLSAGEIMAAKGPIEYNRELDDLLLYGSYPEVVTTPNERVEMLRRLASSYLYRDVLGFQDVRRIDLMEKLLVALALQVGNEVSINELATLAGADRDTISRYLFLLEQAFIIFRLGALSRNPRTEISKMKKIFFYDNGIRNALISNFAPLDLRVDKGALWENFIISEKIKANHYAGKSPNIYFWRTKTGNEVDYIEEMNGRINGYEIKLSSKAKAKGFTTFLSNYPDSTASLVSRENHLEFLEG